MLRRLRDKRHTSALMSIQELTVSRAQGFVEYTLIILFVAIAVALALSLLGPQIAAIFPYISNAL